MTDIATGAEESAIVQQLAAARRERRPLHENRIAVLAGGIVLFGGLLLLWEWIGGASRTNALFFSTPSAIWESIKSGVRGDLLTLDARYTLGAALIGFAIAAVAGVVSAFALSQATYLYKVVSPLFTLLNSMPRVALAPLFIMWFGIGMLSHVVIAASLTFFIVFANTFAGVESVDQDHLLLARLQGATRWQTFQKFIIPSALPGIFVGLELGLIFGMLGTVAAEMIVGEAGFGVRMQRDAGVFNTAGYFATLITLVVITGALIGCFGLIKRRLLRWQATHLLKRT